MAVSTAHPPLPHLVDRRQIPVYAVVGPTVEYLTPLLPDDDSPCLLRGTIPPGGVVPMHAHPDPETFILISGEVDGLTRREPEAQWQPIRPGDVFHVPGEMPHAWRNQAREPAVMYLITTARIGRFFQEVGAPLAADAQPPGPPTPEALRHFQETSARYGYWNASPEENARVGITLAFSPDSRWEEPRRT